MEFSISHCANLNISCDDVKNNLRDELAMGA
jgi:hypothetical protein